MLNCVELFSVSINNTEMLTHVDAWCERSTSGWANTNVTIILKASRYLTTYLIKRILECHIDLYNYSIL